MKIELKLSADAIFAINAELADYLLQYRPRDKAARLCISIIANLSNKFDRKARVIMMNVINSKKKDFKIVLECHEAIILETVLNALLKLISDTYKKHLLSDASGKLNQKLA